jgi:hypothetical protein
VRCATKPELDRGRIARATICTCLGGEGGPSSQPANTSRESSRIVIGRHLFVYLLLILYTSTSTYLKVPHSKDPNLLQRSITMADALKALGNKAIAEKNFDEAM